MLNYIKIYGYSELQNAGEAVISMNLEKMWEDIALIEKNESIELKAAPPEEKETKPSVLSMILPITKPSKLKAAFVYDVPPEKSGWVSDHERGRQYAQTVLGDQAETSVYIIGDETKQYELLEGQSRTATRCSLPPRRGCCRPHCARLSATPILW